MSERALAVRQAGAAPAAAPAILQRKCSCEETGESCPRCAAKRKPLQRFAIGPAAPQAVPGVVQDVLGTSGQPLPSPTRTQMEGRFGHDFSGVRIHDDGPAAASAAAVKARAYTVGRHIVLGRKAPDLTGAAGRRLLGHELAHVVQQSRGGVASGIDPDPALEAEADRAGARVAAGRSIRVGSTAPIGIQRDAEASEFPRLELIAASIAGSLGLSEGTSRVVAASLEGGLSGFSHQWNEGGTGQRLGEKRAEFSLRDIPEIYQGYEIGVLEGVVSPITDLFGLGVMIEQLVAFVGKLASSAITKAEELALELNGVIASLTALDGPIKTIFKQLREGGARTLELLKEMFRGNAGLADRAVGIARSVGRTEGAAIAKSLESPWDTKKEPEEAPAGPLGKISNAVGGFRDKGIKTPWAKVGNKAGYALGFALVQVAMLTLTDGIGNLITQIGGRLGGLAKAGSFLGRTLEGVGRFVKVAGGIVTGVEEAVNAVVSLLMKPLMPVLEPLLKPLSQVLERLGGVLRKLLGIAEKDAAELATTAAAKALGGAHPPAPHVPAPGAQVPHGAPHPAPKAHAEPLPAAKPAPEPHPATKPASEPHPQSHAPEKVAEPGAKAPHPASDAAHKPLAPPEPVAGGHHTQVTPSGIELCSPAPCPNLALVYKKQLSANPELRKEMEELEALRKIAARREEIGKPNPGLAEVVSKRAAELQAKLEAAKLGKVMPSAKPVAPVPASPPPNDHLFTGVISTKELGNHPKVIDRLSRAREFDIGGYHSMTGKGEFGRVGDYLDSDEALQNAYLRMMKDVERSSAATKNNPAIALSKSNHQMIKNLNMADMKSMTPHEVLEWHLSQIKKLPMKNLDPDMVVKELRKEAERFIKESF